jgi:integrase/recombinase XerD
MPKRRPGLPGQLSAEEIMRILDHTTSLKHWTIIATFYATALRCDDFRNLKVCDIDRKRMVIFVRQASRARFRCHPYSSSGFAFISDSGCQRTGCSRPKQRQHSPLEDASIRVLCRTAGHRGRIGRRIHPHLFRHYAASRIMPHCACGAPLGGLAMLIDTA